MAQKEETRFKEKVHADLKTLEHSWFFKTSERAVRGILDDIICCRGVFVAVELKLRENKKKDALQDYNIARIIACGGYAFKAYPDTWPEIFKVIQDIDAGRIGPREPSARINPA